MSDENPVETSTETPAQTLEQIAAEFQAPQTPTAPQSTPVAQEQPNFETTEQFQEWSANQLATVSEQLNSVTSELDSKKAAEHVETQEKAINQAIEKIRNDVDLPDSFIEGRLHVEYARKEAFRKIFDNRAQNPAAYERALGVISADLKNDSVWTPDPQGAENSRAVKNLQKSANRAPSQVDPNEKYRNMNQAEFDHEWEKLKNG